MEEERNVISTEIFIPLRIFADRHNITVEEGEKLILNFSEASFPPAYDEIEWFYCSRSCMIAKYDKVIEPDILYYGHFCNESVNCTCSNFSKGELDKNTGSLTIHSIALNDENFYFYNYNDTGNNHTIYVEVHGKIYLVLSSQMHSISNVYNF